MYFVFGGAACQQGGTVSAVQPKVILLPWCCGRVEQGTGETDLDLGGALDGLFERASHRDWRPSNGE